MLFKIILKSLFIFFYLTSYSHAYLDPGSTNIILQVLAALIAGAGVTFSMWWTKFKSLFNKKKDEVEKKSKD